jgi:hypothetical protein
MSCGFLRFDVHLARGIEHLKLKLIHFDLVRVKRPVFCGTIVLLAGLERDGVGIRHRTDQFFEVLLRNHHRVSMLVDHF